jgi:NADPH:quinone reductase-like Zn-dependent oxidoreductase
MAAEGAFQAYPVLLDHMTAPIPDYISCEQAVVLPLGVSTAACGLFQKDLLGLRCGGLPRRRGRGCARRTGRACR